MTSMPWKTIIPADLPIIETCYMGDLTRADLFDAARTTLALGKEHGRTLFLGDCTELTAGPSVFDLYYLAREISLNNTSRTLKEAVILPNISAFLENLRFWETIGRNRGFMVQIFRERKTALEWLIK